MLSRRTLLAGLAATPVFAACGGTEPGTQPDRGSSDGAPSSAPQGFVWTDARGTAIDLASSVTGVHTGLTASSPSHGSVAVSGDVVTYTPATGFYGTDNFTYSATGPGGTSATAVVSVTVGTPAAPVAANVNTSVSYDAAKAIDLSTAITGVHTSIAIAAAPIHGATSPHG